MWVTPRRLFGLAPTGGYRATAVTSGAVGSYPTVSPLPSVSLAASSGRSVLCGPFRHLAVPRRYLAVYPLELGLSSTVEPRLLKTPRPRPSHPALRPFRMIIQSPLPGHPGQTEARPVHVGLQR